MIQKDYLIIAHPRSGTGYASKLFSFNGIEIGHEKMMKRGTSNWQYAVDCEFYPYTNEPKNNYKFKHIIHIVRNPLDCINSVAFTEWQSEPFRREHIEIKGGNIFERAIDSIFEWTILCQKIANVTVKTESLAHYMSFMDIARHNERNHYSVSEDNLLEMLSEKYKDKYLYMLKCWNDLP
jgi:hypothetical protein